MYGPNLKYIEYEIDKYEKKEPKKVKNQNLQTFVEM